jgi:hypothetical protein
MKLRRDEQGAPGSGTLIEPLSTEIAELDLYDELVTFTTLSPDQQREELEHVAQASAQPVTAAEEPPASFDFLEQSDLPARDEPGSNSSTEPAFNLIDEPLCDPLDQRHGDVSAHPVFAFVEESSQETSLASEDNPVAAEPPDALRRTSPLEDIYAGAMTTPECELKCESCGAASSLEDLFCLSCGQLLGEMD